MVSPKTAKPIILKYSSLPRIVNNLEPNSVSVIFKNSNNHLSFFPSLGLFSIEFALAYCVNLHAKNKKNFEDEMENNK